MVSSPDAYFSYMIHIVKSSTTFALFLRLNFFGRTFLIILCWALLLTYQTGDVCGCLVDFLQVHSWCWRGSAIKSCININGWCAEIKKLQNSQSPDTVNALVYGKLTLCSISATISFTSAICLIVTSLSSTDLTVARSTSLA